MNLQYRVLVAVIVMLLNSCQQKDNKLQKNNNSLPIKEAVKPTTPISSRAVIKDTVQKINTLSKQEESDPVIDVLEDALEKAKRRIGRKTFFKKYKITSDDATSIVEINYNYHFSKSCRHLIIRREIWGTKYLDVFLKKGKSFKNILSLENSYIEFPRDTIMDINGDGLKDILLKWSGCCGHGGNSLNDVYLLKGDKKYFAEKTQLENATFFPKKKLILGVGYGEVGYVCLYKSKWYGYKWKDIECISIERNKKGKRTGRYLVQKIGPDKSLKLVKKLKSVPKEYKNIEGYSLFIGDESTEGDYIPSE